MPALRQVLSIHRSPPYHTLYLRLAMPTNPWKSQSPHSVFIASREGCTQSKGGSKLPHMNIYRHHWIKASCYSQCLSITRRHFHNYSLKFGCGLCFYSVECLPPQMSRGTPERTRGVHTQYTVRYATFVRCSNINTDMLACLTVDILSLGMGVGFPDGSKLPVKTHISGIDVDLSVDHLAQV